MYQLQYHRLHEVQQLHFRHGIMGVYTILALIEVSQYFQFPKTLYKSGNLHYLSHVKYSDHIQDFQMYNPLHHHQVLPTHPLRFLHRP